MRRLLLAAWMAAGLMLGATAAAAQPASPESSAVASPAPPEAGTEPVTQLPIPDWNQWSDHKALYGARLKLVVDNAKRPRNQVARHYGQVIDVHRAEMAWLANHEPQDCYRDEYADWGDTVADLRGVHNRAMSHIRAGKKAALRQARKQEKAATKELDRLLSSISDCAAPVLRTRPAGPDSPLMGKWVRSDYYVAEDGFLDTSRHRLTMADGFYQWRDGSSALCRNNGHGFRPMTARSNGDYFVTGGTHQLIESEWVIHCHPRGGRVLMWRGDGGGVYATYGAGNDILINGPFCWWRAGSGSPKDCDAFWRGERLTVPAIVGMDAQAAVKALGEARLVAVPKDAFSDTIPAGVVVSQSLAFDTGRRIAYVVSIGPDPEADVAD